MTVSVYKPVSKGDGNLVVLLDRGGGPRTIQLVDGQGNVIEESAPGALTNGGRPTYRFSRPGRGYDGPVYVRAGRAIYPVRNPGARYENIAPGRLDAQPTQSTQATRPTAPQMGNPLTSAAVGLAPLASQDARQTATDWLSNGIGKIRGMFGKSNVLTTPFTSMGTTTAAGTPSVSAALSGASGTPAWASGINAAAPYVIPAIAGLKVLQGLTGPSAEERFEPLFNQYFGNPSPVPQLPDSPYNAFKTQYRSTIPSANNLIHGSANAARKAGRKTVPDAGKQKAPTTNVGDGGIFTQGGKPYVMLEAGNPLLDAFKINEGSRGVGGRTAVSLNSYARYKNAFDNRQSAVAEANRGGK